MKFDLKDMYKFLLSHTFPGLLVGIEIILSFYLFTHFCVLEFLKNVWHGNAFLLIIMGYAFSTLLGSIIDGIHHFFYEDFKDKKLAFNLIFEPDEKEIEKFSKDVSKKKFEAIADDTSLNIYRQFLDDDLWYPYETYANIGIAMIPGWFLLLYALIYNLFGSWIFASMLIAIYTFCLLIMHYEARETHLVFEKDEEQFSEVFSKRNNK